MIVKEKLLLCLFDSNLHQRKIFCLLAMLHENIKVNILIRTCRFSFDYDEGKEDLE